MRQEGEAPASIPLADLRPKQELQGTVKKIELYGAFVDVGVGRDGLLHISQLKAERVNRVEDVVQLGQSLTVWVKKVDPTAGRLELTLIKPVAVEWDEIGPGRVFKGKVTRVEKFGAFVDIGAERPGLIHVSELASGRVGHPSEVVKVGDEVEVKVIGLDRKKRQINLSIKALEEAEAEIEADEPAATAMELALRQAMKGMLPRRPAKARKKSGNAVVQAEREEIFSRTLRQHRKA